MSWRFRTTCLCAVMALAAPLVAGCGGDEEQDNAIPRQSAEVLLTLLDDAEQQFESGECDELQATLGDLSQEVDAVSNAEVEPNLHTALATGTDRLAELANRCQPAEELTVTETVPAPVPPPTTEIAPLAPTEETETKEKEQRPKPEKPPKPEEPPPKPEKPPKPEEPEEPEPPDPCPRDAPRC